ncbi:hypothetical protein D5O62_03380 [Salmonella enterica subsp. enterica serovar Warnow]|nr:hypothetical protein [Salmonella enterica subsp. enterica serovar Warnow]
MSSHDLELPRDGRLVLHIKNYKVTKIEVVGKDKHLMSLQDFIELYHHAGYVSLHKDDIPEICESCEHCTFVE